MLKPTMQLAVSQRLTMTPQLQHAIRLLQLSARDLEQEVQTALEDNIMLETEADAGWNDVGARKNTTDNVECNEAFGEMTHVEYTRPRQGRPAPEGMGAREIEAVDDEPLRSHLWWQLE